MTTRVLYLIRSYGMGGVQRVVQLLLNHLPRDEFEIITIPYDTGSEHDQAFIESVERQGHQVASERIPWRGPSDWFSARSAIRELVRKHEFDVIHTHDDQSNMLVGVGRVPWPCACVASAYGWFESNWNLSLRTQYALERRFALPNFDYIYTVSQNMRDKIVASGTKPDRVRVIHTGIEVEQFVKRGVRPAIRSEFGIPQNALVVGTVSRLSSEKGHRYLLVAAESLMRSHPRMALLCVGTGNQRGPLEAQAKQLGLTDRVHFTGFYDDLPGVLEAMDIFALPSILDEGFPTSALEAQAAGLPIVASDSGGTRETIDIGMSGLLTKPADSASLAQALGELLTDEERRCRMGARAREWIRDSFSMTSMLSQIADLYRQASSRRDSRIVSVPRT